MLHRAQRTGTLAETGPYARIRHPQYVGFVLIMLGFLVQWPTILTVLMFPILVLMYWRLSLAEEREALREFGAAYEAYAIRVPRFVPRRRGVGGEPGGPPPDEESAVTRVSDLPTA